MNAKYRLAARRRGAHSRRRRGLRQDPHLLELLQAAAAIARPRPEPDPSARRVGRSRPARNRRH